MPRGFGLRQPAAAFHPQPCCDGPPHAARSACFGECAKRAVAAPSTKQQQAAAVQSAGALAARSPAKRILGVAQGWYESGPLAQHSAAIFGKLRTASILGAGTRSLPSILRRYRLGAGPIISHESPKPFWVFCNSAIISLILAACSGLPARSSISSGSLCRSKSCVFPMRG